MPRSLPRSGPCATRTTCPIPPAPSPARSPPPGRRSSAWLYPDSMAAVAEFEALRPRMLGLAYRMLGSVQEAEDIVQDAYLRWSKAPAIESPAGWLTKVVTNLCLN